MPGRFLLTPVALTNDPFCEDGFCGDPPSGSPVYDYCAFGNIPLRVYWTTTAYRKTVACNTGQTIVDASESLSGSNIVTTCTVWLATRDIAYPAPIPASQSFPPFGYFSPNLTWDIPCNAPSNFLMSRNGIILTRDAGTNTTVANDLYGGNIDYFTTISAIVSQTLTITKVELRGNVAGLGVIGDDITDQGLVLLPQSAGGLPASQTFTSFANATP